MKKPSNTSAGIRRKGYLSGRPVDGVSRPQPRGLSEEPRPLLGSCEDRAVRVAIGHGGLRGRVTLRRKPIRGSVTAPIDVMGFRRGPRLRAVA